MSLVDNLDKVIFTGRRDYLKILSDDDITISTGGTVDSDGQFPGDPSPGSDVGQTNVAHSLGSIPFVRAFWDAKKNSRLYGSRAFDGSAPLDPWLKVVATTTQVKFYIHSNSAQSNIPVYYRIYELGDESFNSNKRIDKIFEENTSSKSVPARPSANTPGTATLSIAHGQGEVVLFNVQFSENQTDWYEMGTEIVGPADTTSGPPGGPYTRFHYTSACAFSDSTNLSIVFENLYDSAKTIYVRYTMDYKI